MFDSSCPVARVADTKTNPVSFGVEFRDPSKRRILEKHVVKNKTNHSRQKQWEFGFRIWFGLFNKPLSGNPEDLVM